MKHWFMWLMLLPVAVGWMVWMEWPDGETHIVVCDVGQGDGILIYAGFSQVIIDGGPGQGTMSSCLGRHVPFWDRTIELAVITHPQKDHYEGVVALLAGYKVQALLTAHPSQLYDLFSGEVGVQNQTMQVVIPKMGERLIVGGNIYLTVLSPDIVLNSGERVFDWQTVPTADMSRKSGSIPGDINEESAIVLLSQTGFHALFTGDAGVSSEGRVMATGLLPDKVTMLKVGHHGSKTSSSQVFLKALRPEMAVISVGRNNSYGHPSPEIVQRLQQDGIRVYRTDEQGDVDVVVGRRGQYRVETEY